jgi:RNA recognition motif-containing protein
MIIWLTGQPGSGKTTLCKKMMLNMGSDVFHIDGDDLRDLFERFVKVHSISLPKVERFEGANVIKEPRGFAYIAFARKEDAEDAMARLDGYGYDHLIIKVEWAKPNKDGSGPGSGVPNQYMSGYGKQLAQDTTEKVYYASNLTGNR